jgi:deazaflavin-dependent oxidoreductase (nitroreductase family)
MIGRGMADDDYCYLTTIGRRSGTPHEIEIWYELDEGAGSIEPGTTIFLLAGGGRGSDWVRNAAANPAVTVRFGADSTVFAGTARLLDQDGADPAEEERARRLVFTKYQGRSGGDLSDWRVRALPVAIDLTVR